MKHKAAAMQALSSLGHCDCRLLVCGEHRIEQLRDGARLEPDTAGGWRLEVLGRTRRTHPDLAEVDCVGGHSIEGQPDSCSDSLF